MPKYSKGGSGYYQQGFKGPREYCAVCGFGFYRETELRKQDGVWKCIVGPHCYDEQDNGTVSSVNHTG